jgi:hypothetical protein
MAGQGVFRRLWLTWFSRPAAERVVHRLALGQKPQRILEIGVGTLVRTVRLLELVRSRAGGGDVQYVGLDPFESRQPGDSPGVTLKAAHRRLHGLARVQLVPGDTDVSLSRLCNHLGAFDFVLVSADSDPGRLDRSWFFIRRMVNERTTILAEARSGAGTSWNIVPKSRVDELAARSVQRRAA